MQISKLLNWMYSVSKNNMAFKTLTNVVEVTIYGRHGIIALIICISIFVKKY